ncbi:MAG: ATP-binding cassette domain-containing protein, partial [Pseudomonadota bacterium]
MLDQAQGEVGGAAQAGEPLLQVSNIEVIYNHVILVLKGVSLQVPKGGITALLGGNGAGKTTTLKDHVVVDHLDIADLQKRLTGLGRAAYLTLRLI